MQITLFRALKGINIVDEDAISVVNGIEAHVESVVNNHIKAVEGRMTTIDGKFNDLQASLDALRGQIQFVGVMLGIIGLAIAAAPIVSKFVR